MIVPETHGYTRGRMSVCVYSCLGDWAVSVGHSGISDMPDRLSIVPVEDHVD